MRYKLKKWYHSTHITGTFLIFVHLYNFLRNFGSSNELWSKIQEIWAEFYLETKDFVSKASSFYWVTNCTLYLRKFPKNFLLFKRKIHSLSTNKFKQWIWNAILQRPRDSACKASRWDVLHRFRHLNYLMFFMILPKTRYELWFLVKTSHGVHKGLRERIQPRAYSNHSRCEVLKDHMRKINAS